ncbi:MULTISPECIES: hypothetical protein [Microbacterium]|uniref:hypothetical protein n=1 Tax=Microbacterium TaxID=33882 RepID=UPI001AE56132
MAVVEGYERGEPIADLAAKLGVHRTTLDNLIKRLELTREDPEAVLPMVRDEIVESYRAGETLAAIGSRHGFSLNKVQRLLVAMGEAIRARGPQGTAPKWSTGRPRELCRPRTTRTRRLEPRDRTQSPQSAALLQMALALTGTTRRAT